MKLVSESFFWLFLLICTVLFSSIIAVNAANRIVPLELLMFQKKVFINHLIGLKLKLLTKKPFSLKMDQAENISVQRLMNNLNFR